MNDLTVWEDPANEVDPMGLRHVLNGDAGRITISFDSAYEMGVERVDALIELVKLYGLTIWEDRVNMQYCIERTTE